MRKYLLLTGAALLGLSSSALAALNCNTPPSCEELGYQFDTVRCPGKVVLKCPFDDSKLFCANPLYPTVITCDIGSILYNDLKCYNIPPEGKTAIAVVFNPSKKLAIDINPPASGLSWGANDIDIPELDNCSASSSPSSCPTDGESNTRWIFSVTGSSTNFAASSCYLSTSGGLPKGFWFLPAAIDLVNIYRLKTDINASMSEAGGSGIASVGSYWSSNESSADMALAFNMVTGKMTSLSKSTKSNASGAVFTRCIVRY